MPFEAGEFKPIINLATRPQMNVADFGAVIDDIGRTVTDLARASRMATGMSTLPAGLTEARVAQMIADAIATISIPAAASTIDLAPLEGRVAALETRPPADPSTPAAPTDLAPLLDRLTQLEAAVTATKVSLYLSIVAARRLSEASSLNNQRNNVGLESITSAEIGMAAVLTGGKADMPRDAAMAIAEHVVAREQAWAEHAATTIIDSPAALDAAINAYLGEC